MVLEVIMNYEHLKLENQLCHRFYVASNAITRSYRPVLEALDITYPQYIVLMALWEGDNITINDIMKRTSIDGGSLTQILNKLSTKKILKLTPLKEDKRKKSVQLTNKGHKLRDKSKEIPKHMSSKVSSLSDSELKHLIALLDKINSDLNL